MAIGKAGAKNAALMAVRNLALEDNDLQKKLQSLHSQDGQRCGAEARKPEMTVLLKIDSRKPDEETLAEAARILRKGGVVAFPTETFYGLGVDARQDTAVEKIFCIKGRNVRNPVSIIIDSKQG